jgi:hypothetical protein
MARTESCRSYFLPDEYRLLSDARRQRVTDVLCFFAQGVPLAEIAAMTCCHPDAARRIIADHVAAETVGEGVLLMGPAWLPTTAEIAREADRLTMEHLDAVAGKDCGPREVRPRGNIRSTADPHRAEKLPNTP